MREIKLSTKEELNIYMSPTRQQLLRQLNIANVSMTPKMLADKLGISASGVQHHIRKLIKLGLLELDHTEDINGITASFYKPAQVIVKVGLGSNDNLDQQRDVLVQNTVAQVYDGFRSQMTRRFEICRDKNTDKVKKWGDILSGVVYLNDQESEEIMTIINHFIEQHAAPKAGNFSWEYALIAYKAEISEKE